MSPCVVVSTGSTTSGVPELVEGPAVVFSGPAGSSIGLTIATTDAITTVRIIVLVPPESSFTTGIIPQR